MNSSFPIYAKMVHVIDEINFLGLQQIPVARQQQGGFYCGVTGIQQ